MRVCIVGAGDGGASAANQIHRLDSKAQIDVFSERPAHYKLVADGKTKTLVGAQIVSEEIVSGTVDKLAVAIACRMPLTKLVQIDSCYSPHVQEDQIAVPLHRLIDELGE